MSSPARVSILIPCYNAEPYLRQTLESALSQTLTPTDILVVDDRSTDRSRLIAESFGPRVTVLENPGTGASAARNYASRMSTGEFLQYLDADDLLEPQALASRVDALESRQADVAISDWQRLVFQKGEWVSGRRESAVLPSGALDLAIVRGFWAPPAALLYRRRVWAGGEGWLDSLPVIQDARFMFDAARRNHRFVHVAGVAAQYRQHASQSLSRRDPVRFWRDVLSNTRGIETLWSDAGRLDVPHRTALADSYSQCALIGLARDKSLFREASAELRRFDDVIPSRRTRVALFVDRVVGYPAARFLLSPRAAH